MIKSWRSSCGLCRKVRPMPSDEKNQGASQSCDKNLTISDDWIAARPSFDLETNPLQIKAESELGKYNRIRVLFYELQGSSDLYAGGVAIYLRSTPQYWLLYCDTEEQNFPTSLPAASEKIWRITKTTTSGIRIQIHCNDVEVLNVLLSDANCADSKWNRYWSRNVGRIGFSKIHDTASQSFRAYRG